MKMRIVRERVNRDLIIFALWLVSNLLLFHFNFCNLPVAYLAGDLLGGWYTPEYAYFSTIYGALMFGQITLFPVYFLWKILKGAWSSWSRQPRNRFDNNFFWLSLMFFAPPVLFILWFIFLMGFVGWQCFD